MTYKIYHNKELWPSYAEVIFSNSKAEFDTAKKEIANSPEEDGNAFVFFQPEVDKLATIVFLKSDNGVVVNQTTHLALQFFRYLLVYSGAKNLSPEEKDKSMISLVPMLTESIFKQIIEARNSNFGIAE